MLDLVPNNEQSYESLRLYALKKTNSTLVRHAMQSSKGRKVKIKSVTTFRCFLFLQKLREKENKNTAAIVTVLLPKLLFSGLIRKTTLSIS